MTAKDKDGNVKTGIRQSTLSQLISGNPTYERLKEIADIVGLSVSELVADNDNDDFVALIRNRGELRAFDTMEALKEYVREMDGR